MALAQHLQNDMNRFNHLPKSFDNDSGGAIERVQAGRARKAEYGTFAQASF